MRAISLHVWHRWRRNLSLKPLQAAVLCPESWRNRLGPDARYVVTDLNQPMLDHAASKQGADDRLEWQQADALELPFDDDEFDAVLLPVRRDVLSRPRAVDMVKRGRVLKPGGRYVFNIWDHIGVNEFADSVHPFCGQCFSR